VQDLVDPRAPDPGDHLLVAQQRVQRPRRRQQLAEQRRVRPRLGAEREQDVLGLERLGPQQLDPRGLLGAELAQPQLAVAGQAEQDARRAVTQRAALGEQLQPARAHEVHEQRERPVLRRVQIQQQQLPAPAHAGERRTLDGMQRRIERLEHVQARRHRRLEHLAGQDAVQPAGGDLHLGQLGHSLDSSSLAAHGPMGAGGSGGDRAARRP
jgi:hypothetical protein